MINQQIESLIKGSRTNSFRIDLDEVLANLRNEAPINVPVPAWVMVEDGQLSFHLRVPSGETLPVHLAQLFNAGEKGPKIYTRKDCFRISARTAKGIAVELEQLSPYPSRVSETSGVTIYRTSFSRITLPAERFDAMDTTELLKCLDKVARNKKAEDSKEDTESSKQKRKSEPKDTFLAIIPDVELLILPDGIDSETSHPFLGKLSSSKRCCFPGETDSGRFCLENKDGDLWVYYERAISAGEVTNARRIFQGILTAIGFTHGCHPWPDYLHHRRDHRVIERWINPHGRSQINPLLPMVKGRLHWSPDAQELFQRAAEFFAEQSDDAEFFSRALWLMREGNYRTMPNEVRLLTLCSVLEGLVKRHTKSKKQVGDENSWKKAIVKAGLDWETWFQEVYRSWYAYRNDLAHGFDISPAKNEGVSEAFVAYSRISAAIYIMMAKRMGFQGQLDRSMLEGLERMALG